jgi:hypothetical protein
MVRISKLFGKVQRNLSTRWYTHRRHKKNNRGNKKLASGWHDRVPMGNGGKPQNGGNMPILSLPMSSNFTEIFLISALPHKPTPPYIAAWRQDTRIYRRIPPIPPPDTIFIQKTPEKSLDKIEKRVTIFYQKGQRNFRLLFIRPCLSESYSIRLVSY